MTLGTAEQILVIVLGVALALFLTLSIVSIVLVIKVLKHIKRIIAKAEQIADKAEHVTSFFEHSAGPVAIGKLLSNIINASREHRDKKG